MSCLKVGLLVLVAVLMGDVAMAKGGEAAKSAKSKVAVESREDASNGRARTPAAPQMGNLSKARRDELTAKIGEIKAFLEQSSDTNATRLLRFAAEVEREVRDKKFGLVFEEHRERVDVELAENLPVLTEDKKRFLPKGNGKCVDDTPLNFLIEGDNLAALKLLEKTHRGKIDLIYIDPPYNTGNKDFIYNDSYVDKADTFRHSKWLSFMKKRLEIMRRLMTQEAYICISIDDNELYSLKMLCDEIFREENFVASIPRRTKSSGKTTKDVSSNHDYVVIYAKDNERVLIGGLDHIDSGFKHEDEFVNERGKYKLNQTLDYDSLQYSKGLDYPITINGEVFYPGQDKAAWKRRMSGDHKRADWEWRWSKEKFAFGLSNGFIVVKRKQDGSARIYTKTYLNANIEQAEGGGYKIVLAERKKRLSTLDFLDKEFSNDNAKKDLKSVFGECPFDYSKPVLLIEKLIGISLVTNGVVLDCFAGSGTTGHAVMKLNAEDGGRRKFILVTNNENGICEKVTYERLKRVMEKEKYAARLKYFKIGYVPIKDKVYYEYADELLEHIRELVELENALDFNADGEIAIAVTDKEFDRFMASESRMAGKKAIYVGHDVLIGKAAREKLKRMGIEIKVIPEYYYSEEEA